MSERRGHPSDFGGLVLARKAGQGFFIGEHIRIIIGKVEGNTVKVHITAPKSIRIIRSEQIGNLPGEEQ